MLRVCFRLVLGFVSRWKGRIVAWFKNTVNTWIYNILNSEKTESLRILFDITLKLHVFKRM